MTNAATFPSLFLLLFCLKVQRCTIYAVPQPSWSGSIIKDMSQMSITLATQHLCPHHAKLPVTLPDYVVSLVSLEICQR